MNNIENMAKLSMCRICLSSDIRLRSSVNTHLLYMYESLTVKMPFVAEDIRPTLACNLCCASLENSYELRRRCLQSEELFEQLLTCNVQVNLQNILNIHLSMEDIMQMTPNVFDNVEVKKENAEDARDNSGISSESKYDADIEYLVKIEPDMDNTMPSFEEDPLPSDDFIQSDSEDMISLAVVKTDLSDVTTSTYWFAAQKYSEDTLLNSLKRTDQTLDNVEESIRQTNKYVDLKPIIKNKIVDTRCDVGIKLYNDKENNSTSDHIDVHEEESENKNSADQSFNSSPSNEHKRLLCDTCQKCFTCKRDLIRHNICEHTGEKPYESNVCKKDFNRKSNLNIHIHTHTDEKPYECNVCKKCFSQKSNLNSHIHTHTGEKPYECNICHNCFRVKSKLDSHYTYRYTMREKPYECIVCKKCFDRESILDVHVRTHTGEKPYECSVCKKCFSHKGSFNRHSRKHTLYQCNIFKKCFNQKSVLNSHICTHTNKKSHVCNKHEHIHTNRSVKLFESHVCGKCFNRKSSLDVHIRTHTGEKPFECNVCKKCFNRKNDLNVHVRSHTGEKPYGCNICKKCFNSKGHLIRYTQDHTGKKSYQCNLCGNSYNDKSNLNIHFRTHTGEKRNLIDETNKINSNENLKVARRKTVLFGKF